MNFKLLFLLGEKVKAGANKKKNQFLSVKRNFVKITKLLQLSPNREQ